MRQTRHGISWSTIALVMLGTVACQDLTGPEVTPPPPDPEEAPAPSLRHNAAVVLRRIDVEGACDGKDIFGDPKKGHFQYRVRVIENAVSGNGNVFTMQSKDYGEWFADHHLRGPGSSIDLNDRTYDVRGLSEDESVTISLYGIEWDLTKRDSRMDGSRASQTRRYSADGTQYYELNLGSGACKIELEYRIDWSTP